MKFTDPKRLMEHQRKQFQTNFATKAAKDIAAKAEKEVNQELVWKSGPINAADLKRIFAELAKLGWEAVSQGVDTTIIRRKSR